jgi:hypothetical protein
VTPALQPTARSLLLSTCHHSHHVLWSCPHVFKTPICKRHADQRESSQGNHRHNLDEVENTCSGSLVARALHLDHNLLASGFSGWTNPKGSSLTQQFAKGLRSMLVTFVSAMKGRQTSLTLVAFTFTLPSFPLWDMGGRILVAPDLLISAALTSLSTTCSPPSQQQQPTGCRALSRTVTPPPAH